MSKDIAKRLLLIHPPEPRKEHLMSSPNDSIYLGKTRWLSVPVFWDYKKLINPHIAIVGITGSGKSYLVKTFITRSSLIWNTNTIILDWAGEYGKWVKQAGGSIIDLSKEHLNLLDLAGMTPGERVKQIMSSLDILANLQDFPNEREDIEAGIEATYKSKKAPELTDLLETLEKTNNKKAARMVRRLTLQGSDFFSGKSTIALSKLLTSGLVCIDLHSLPSEELRSLAGLTILQFIKEKMRRETVQEEKGIQLLVVLDEAWKIAQDERSDVITIIREGRKYNFALLVASQNPNDMHKTIFSNVGTMFAMRLVLREFRKYVQDSLNYSDYVDSEISKFGVGDAAVHMIFSGRQPRVQTFLMQKIDGEAPLFIFRIKGGKMEMEIEREQFMRALYELGLTEDQMSIIRSAFEKADGTLSGTKIVEALETFGYSKAAIISFLRQLGIPEKGIIEMFSLARRKKASRGVADIVLED
ncbi:DNA import protein CedB [uncultured archaeon]|nr:DNA import protein CedB [uncultured archaeon]